MLSQKYAACGTTKVACCIYPAFVTHTRVVDISKHKMCKSEKVIIVAKWIAVAVILINFGFKTQKY